MRSRDTSLKIEQNEQEHGIVKNEDSIVKSERPYKSRKRRINEDSMVKSERPYKSRKGRINEWYSIEAVKILFEFMMVNLYVKVMFVSMVLLSVDIYSLQFEKGCFSGLTCSKPPSPLAS